MHTIKWNASWINAIKKSKNNGYLAFFDNLVSVSISKYDVIETFNKLGYFEDYFIFYFIKGEEKYSYEEIMETNWSYKC